MELSTEQVFETLSKKDPVSLIRCGDGEKIVLEGFKSFGNFNAVLKRQLGFSPSISDAETIRENLINAIDGCDILGVPRHKNLNDLSSHWRDVEKTIEKYVTIIPEKKCSLDIHYDFLNSGLFNKLLRAENPAEVCLITCRNIDHVVKLHFNLQRVDRFEIPPEVKFTSYEGKPHYPYYFNRVETWMDKMSPQGKLLLVGAGFIGKIYCNWWRDRGGRAFDIGSVFDEWAGRVTRGPGRELDKVEHSKFSLYENIQ